MQEVRGSIPLSSTRNASDDLSVDGRVSAPTLVGFADDEEGDEDVTDIIGDVGDDEET